VALYQVDAFTDRAFTGNPAAVCLLPVPGDPVWMQQVAREMNLSETAFLHRQGETFSLRWFTPTIEVDLCGHATLASAHILWETGQLPLDEPARFDTLSGRLTATRRADWIVLDFPADPPAPVDAAPELVAALGVTPLALGRNRDYLVEVKSAAEVRAARPDLARLAGVVTRGVILTSRSDTAEYDFVSRFFAPRAGIDEDPVTGSAHCGLGPYWGTRLGKTELIGYQASARSGVVRVRLAGARVDLCGQAVTVMRGELVA
jgi:PhzF family phenazine biosynthesis protein